MITQEQYADKHYSDLTSGVPLDGSLQPLPVLNHEIRNYSGLLIFSVQYVLLYYCMDGLWTPSAEDKTGPF